jgi:hypothetical protein
MLVLRGRPHSPAPIPFSFSTTMPIETICQGCAKKLRVGDEHAGKQARCPSCGAIYKVPGITPSSYSPAASEPIDVFGGLASSTPTTKTETPSGPSAFANPPAKETERWFLRIDDGREFGPIDRPTLDQWFRERRIGPGSQLRRENETAWRPAASVFPSLAMMGSAQPAGSSAANPFSDNPYQSPGAARGATRGPAYGATRAYAEAHRGGLILALGIVSWVTGCFLIGIAAWIMASGDLKKMRAGVMDSSGMGLTQAGMIIGIIHTVLTGLMFAFFFFMIIIGAVN